MWHCKLQACLHLLTLLGSVIKSCHDVTALNSVEELQPDTLTITLANEQLQAIWTLVISSKVVSSEL